MNKTELTVKVAEKLELSNNKATDAVNAVLGAIEASLCRGEIVNIPGFGKFDLVERAARTGRNPKTGEAVSIAARMAIKFCPANSLREAVNAPQNV